MSDEFDDLLGLRAPGKDRKARRSFWSVHGNSPFYRTLADLREYAGTWPETHVYFTIWEWDSRPDEVELHRFGDGGLLLDQEASRAVERVLEREKAVRDTMTLRQLVGLLDALPVEEEAR